MQTTLPNPDLTQLPTRAPDDFDKKDAEKEMEQIHADLIEWQEKLYAENKQSVLIVLQGMDASGKDGLIRRVFSGLNPQGVRVFSFKEPTKEELAHDFLWRIHRRTPARGMVHVFNRSHYEDVLITRVVGLISNATAAQRFEAINHFEQLLQQNGTKVLKFYLNVSEEEQQERLQERIDDPDKQWKYEPGDADKAKQWPAYRGVYEDVFRRTSPPACPWHLVPADQNWYKAYFVAKTLRDALRTMNPAYPASKLERPE